MPKILERLNKTPTTQTAFTIRALSKRQKLLGAAALAVAFLPTVASAFTTPAVGSLAYDVYNVVINQGVQGAIGFTAGVLALVFGGFRAISGQLMTGVMALIAGIILINAANIVVSLGMTV